jgi:hexosaminidase
MNINRRDLIGVAAVLLTACGPFRGGQGPVPATLPAVAVVPAPASLQVLGGAAFVLDSTSTILVDGDSAWGIANTLARMLRVPTGYMLNVASATGAIPTHGIRVRLETGRTDLGDEGYALLVTADSVRLVARTPAGLFHGVQTIRQLLPFGIESENSTIRMGDWKMPAVSITDRPRFAWRGAMLDVSRHFFSVDEVKQYIDFLALYKMNMLHLHLGDDQGFRVDLPSHPELVRAGSASQVGGDTGGYYTASDYADIVRYAADRFITVVPEIDMPAHSNALLISHPNLSCGRIAPAPYTGIHVGFSAICPDSEASFRLIDDIVGDLAAMTPGPFFHMGGDEVQALTRDQYIRFVNRVQDIVNAHGKRLVGWEEIYKAALKPTSIAQQWASTDSLHIVVDKGAKVIFSPASKVYLDMKFTDATELGLKWAGLVDVPTAYNWDPATLVPNVTEPSIMGVEAPLWTETVRNISAAFYLVAPRLPAVAEVGWTPQASRNWDDFRLRLAAQAPRWRLMGVNYYPSTTVPWF